jgi:hypothetical protein
MLKTILKRNDLLRLLSHQSSQTTFRCVAMSRLQSTIAGLPFELQDSSLFQTGAMIGNEWISKAESGKTYNVGSILFSSFRLLRVPSTRHVWGTVCRVFTFITEFIYV